jgi:hypothetical protein
MAINIPISIKFYSSQCYFKDYSMFNVFVIGSWLQVARGNTADEKVKGEGCGGGG